VKFEVADSFRADFRRLSDDERRLFLEVLPLFVEACDRHGADPAAAWPSALRVKPIVGAPGIFEMIWSFAGPDGRATFEWIRIDGELALRWRRIGGHRILGTA
jgi:hypothetical protein